MLRLHLGLQTGELDREESSTAQIIRALEIQPADSSRRNFTLSLLKFSPNKNMRRRFSCRLPRTMPGSSWCFIAGEGLPTAHNGVDVHWQSITAPPHAFGGDHGHPLPRTISPRAEQSMIVPDTSRTGLTVGSSAGCPLSIHFGFHMECIGFAYGFWPLKMATIVLIGAVNSRNINKTLGPQGF
jgi:hypothetical protein